MRLKYSMKLSRIVNIHELGVIYRSTDFEDILVWKTLGSDPVENSVLPPHPTNLPGHVSFPDTFHVHWLLSWLFPRLGTLGQPQLIYSLPSNRQTQAMN